MSASDFLESKVLDHILGGPDYTRAATVYIALSTTTPTESGGITEPVGNAYARVAVTNNATNFPAAAAGQKTNGTTITFTTATGSWGTITHFAIFDASTSGNMLFSGPLDNSRNVANGTQLSFVTGTLIITAD